MALASLGLATLIRLASNSEITLLGLKGPAHAQPTQPFFSDWVVPSPVQIFFFFGGGGSLYILYISPVPYA